MTTTRAPGLTAAMRRALEDARDHGDSSFRVRGRSEAGGHSRVVFVLRQRGLIDFFGNITPRGQAALAAPRMTAAELQMMDWADAGKRIPTALMLTRAYESIWSKGWLEPDEATGGKLTPTGLAALNNMRAAMGSAEYKEQP